MDAAQLGSDPQDMSHKQAYHTSCRAGLGGHSGFQFNAASHDISPEFLSLLAAAHAGYHAPRDLPLEPTPDQLSDFPVALKHKAVDGTPVVSQTVYVGREFRGQGGKPDTGRFGNYFSHIVIGDPGGPDAFDGLLPIELWRAPHWRTEEATTSELPELPALTPGRCDLEWALGTLGGPRREWLGPILGAALSAIDGGPRVVIVEQEPARAAAWIAWVSYALPPELARELSFSTFDGQPRYAQDINLCVTTPGCDVGFADYEHGRDVVVIEPATATAPDADSLYARILAALAAEGAEAVARLPRIASGPPESRGAELAITAGRIDLARDSDSASLLECLTGLVRLARWELAGATADAMPPHAVGEDALLGWWRTHREARESTAVEARSIADAALRRLLPAIPDLPSDLEEIPSDSPTSPSPGALASWLEMVEASDFGSRRAALIDAGLKLGLVGCNVALDRRVANAVGQAIADHDVAATFARMADDPKYAAIVEEVVSALATAAFSDERALPLLRSTLTHPSLRDTTDRFAARATGFDERAVWERLRVEMDPDAMRGALAALIPLADQDGRTSEVKLLFGPGRPAGKDDYLLLLGAYQDAKGTAAVDDVAGALAVLDQEPLANLTDGQRLTEALRRTTPREELAHHPVFLAWTAAQLVPPQSAFADWAGWVNEAATAENPRISDPLWEELWAMAGEVAVRALDFAGVHDPGTRPGRAAEHADPDSRRDMTDPMGDYTEGIHTLSRAFGEHWPGAAALGLEREITRHKDASGLIVNAFLIWRRLPQDTGDLIETALAAGIGRVTARRLEGVERLLAVSERDDWLEWLDRHPPRAGVSGTVSRLLRRDSRQQ
jgi:hypothetical protein